MIDPGKLEISNYSYNLPEEKIAYYPLAERDQSKLLVWKNEIITEDIYKNIAGYLPEKSLLIFNDTKVIHARILFSKPSGAKIELFCLEPFRQKDYAHIMNETSPVQWKCMIGGASKWKEGVLEKHLSINKTEVILKAKLQQKLPGAYVTEFTWHPSQFTFAQIINEAGQTPLPPYIKRKTNKEDEERYHTIYANKDGSVAAPTAGLHFTSNIFNSLQKKNIAHDFVTLHVGSGTFKPVKSALISDHEMHAELMEVSAAAIENIVRNLNDNIVAVGTTSLRVLESLYWMGVKAYLQPSIDEDYLFIKQWEVYELPLAESKIETGLALQALLTWMKIHGIQRLLIKTQIIIVPGYGFKIVKALVTNFHQPNSTLLLLVAAIAGERWKKIYEYALQNDFRFLSYGDGCLIFLSSLNNHFISEL